MPNDPDTRLVAWSADDFGQMRVRAEFLLHHTKSKAARNTATGLLFLINQHHAAWEASLSNSAFQARIDACFADAASTRNDVRLAVLSALGCVSARETNEKPA